MHILEGHHLDVDALVFQESLHAGEKILLSVLGAEDLGELVDTGGQRFFYPWVVDFGELVVKRLESWPLIGSIDQDKGWEVERGVKAHVFV